MPRWKALPEEFDPQIREFVSELRMLVERSGLTVDALAGRTGFSETSWERYLDGRILPPRRAVVALADVTGTPQHHLTNLWESAERSWSRAGTGHDMTDETLRIGRVRETLGATDAAADGGPNGQGFDAYGSDHAYASHHAYGSDPHRADPHRPDDRAPFVPAQRGTVPPVPQQRQAGPQADAERGGLATDGRGRAISLAVGAAGALIVVVGALMLAPSGDKPAEAAPPTPTAAPTSQAPGTEEPTTEEPAPAPPAGVECQGADCTGQNPDEMGCGGEYARTVTTTGVGASRVEVRYSEVCSAAWARLTEAAPGDTVTITGSAAEDGQHGEVTVSEAYTPMVAVKQAADAKACATLTSGTKGCTT